MKSLKPLLLIFSPFFLPLLVQGQSADKNYVRARTPRVALQPSEVADASTDKAKVQSTVQYMDGLGRPLQTVQQQGSPTGQDVVQPFEYDVLGREAKKYLPYTQVPGTTPGVYRADAITTQAAFYQVPNAGNANNAAPYSLSVFENSPLNRVTEQGAPGAAWQPVQGANTGHTLKIDYQLNDAADFKVKQYGVNIDANTGARTLIDQGTYTAKTLWVTISKSENWTAAAGKLETVEEYKDLEGHVVLKRTFNYNKTTSANETLSTYYVYDDMGELSFVLPPLAGPDGGLTSAGNQDILNSLCYQYIYDERGRLTQKRLPGKDWEYMVYNQLDQQVLSQDGRQRASNQWTVAKYDAHGRVIMTGLWNAGSAIPLATLQQSIYAAAQYDMRDFTGNTSSYPNGYVINSYPATLSTILSVNYYDERAGIPGLPAVYTAPAGNSSKTIGMVVAGYTAVLNDVPSNTNAVLWKVPYYDDEGRIIAAYKQHYWGGLSNLSANNYDLVVSSYDFTGQLMAATRQHYKNNSGSAALQVTVANAYSYDQMGRKLQAFESINGATPVLLSQSVYNELSQLRQKQLHSTNAAPGMPYNLVLGAADAVTSGTKTFVASHSITMGNGFTVASGASVNTSIASFLQTVTFDYNERGWLTGSTAPLFAMQLTYNKSSSTGPFNGNISAQAWGTPGNLDKNFSYSYDNLNRLTDGVASANVNISETGISYDAGGNLKTLTRSGPSAATLTYNSYNGNQLLNVANGSNTAFRTYGTYDANGNAPSDGQGNTITYNLLNLPQSITAKSLTYTYDAAGEKLRKTSGSSSTTEYIAGIQWDNSAGSGMAINFIQTETGRAVRNSDGSYTYQYDLSDHLGNTRITFNQNPTSGQAQVLQADNYYPFGLRASETAGQNHYLYNNKELQDELNQYDYGARFYDPVIARWTSVDPLAELFRKWTPYNYVINNPISRIDPDGMFSTDVDVSGKVINHTNDGDPSVYINLGNGTKILGGYEDPDKNYKPGDQYTYYNPTTAKNYYGQYMIPASAYNYSNDAINGKGSQDLAFITNGPGGDIGIGDEGILNRAWQIFQRDLNAPQNGPTVEEADDVSTVLLGIIGVASPRAIGTTRDNLLKSAENGKLQRIIDRTYREGAQVGNGGTAAAYRLEQLTNVSVGGRNHTIKIFELRTALTKLWRNRANLSPADRQIVKFMLTEVQHAISGN